MTTHDAILIVLFCFVGLPVLSYMVVKFGTVGYFNAKKRNKKDQEDNK